MNNWDKIIIKTKGVRIIIDDPELKFALLQENYDSDGDRESEPYSIQQLVNNAEEYRQTADLRIQTNFEGYRKDIQKLQDAYDKVTKENRELTEKLKQLFLGEKR